MLKKVVEEQFGYLKKQDKSEAKAFFGKLWAALASKRVRFLDGEIFMSWRPLSAELAKIYNEWYGTRFTTDAFIKAFNPDTPMGVDDQYDDIIRTLLGATGCIGIYHVRMGPAVSSRDEVFAYSEISLVTGEEKYYTQSFKCGRPCGQPTQITPDAFERICYSR